MSRNRDTANVQYNGVSAVPPFVAGKNLIINGGMDIWQRGTSFAYSNSVYVYSADRFEHVRNGYTLGATASRQTAGLEGFRYCLRIQRDSGNTSTQGIYIDHSIETQESLRVIGKTVTLSFYARKGVDYSASGNVLTARLLTGTGTDQALKNYTNVAVPLQSDFVLSTNWQRFSFTGIVTAGVNEIGINFMFNPTSTALTNDYYEITGIQLEQGSTATPFSRAGGTLQGELAACQRYYETWTAGGANYGLPGTVIWKTSTSGIIQVNFAVPKRTSPSVTFGNVIVTNGNTALTPTAMSFFGAGSSLGVIGGNTNVSVASGGTSGAAGFVLDNSTGTAYINWSSEL